jgi:hypothetical protein
MGGKGGGTYRPVDEVDEDDAEGCRVRVDGCPGDGCFVAGCEGGGVGGGGDEDGGGHQRRKGEEGGEGELHLDSGGIVLWGFGRWEESEWTD